MTLTRRRLLGAALAAAVCLQPGRARTQAIDPLYVCVQDDAKIAVVDMKTRAVARTIDLQKLGFPATAKPHFVVVEPDGAFWYPSLIGANKVVKFDRRSKIVGQFEMGRRGCSRSPDRTRSSSHDR